MKNYKTIISCILVICLSFIVISCGRDSTSKSHPSNYEQLTQLLGKKQETVFKELSLSEDDVQSLAAGLYETSIKVDYLGSSFDVLLAFDVENDEMYGFWYRQTYSDNVEQATTTVNTLYQKLVKIHGKTDTEKGNSGRLENNLENLEENLSGKNVFSSTEMWKFSNELNLYFNISADGNSNVSIQLEYQKIAK